MSAAIAGSMVATAEAASLDLRIPGKLTRVGLEIPEGLDVEQWKQLGATLNQLNTCAQWAVGDWLAYGEQQPYGKHYEDAEEITTVVDAVRYIQEKSSKEKTS